MRVSSQTIENILSNVEEPQLVDLYKRTLPLVCMRRHLFRKFLESKAALLHASLLEKTFNLSFQIKDMGPNTLSTVLNMYLIETTPGEPEYEDFDWNDFKEMTLKRMKLLRNGASEIQIQRVERKIYRTR